MERRKERCTKEPSGCLVEPSIEGLLETRGDAQGSNSQAARRAQEPAKARSSRSSSRVGALSKPDSIRELQVVNHPLSTAFFQPQLPQTLTLPLYSCALTWPTSRQHFTSASSLQTRPLPPTRASSLHAPPHLVRPLPIRSPSAWLSKRMLE